MPLPDGPGPSLIAPPVEPILRLVLAIRGFFMIPVASFVLLVGTLGFSELGAGEGDAFMLIGITVLIVHGLLLFDYALRDLDRSRAVVRSHRIWRSAPVRLGMIFATSVPFYAYLLADEPLPKFDSLSDGDTLVMFLFWLAFLAPAWLRDL